MRVWPRLEGPCAISIPTSFSFGSIQKLVPHAPAHIASPLEPGVQPMPSSWRTPKPMPNPYPGPVVAMVDPPIPTVCWDSMNSTVLRDR